MKYCVNCAASYETPDVVCASCWLDPTLPEAMLDAELARLDGVRSSAPHAIGYPGETASLRLALAASMVLVALLGTASFGLFAVLLAVELVRMRMRLLTTRENLAPATPTTLPKVHRLAKVAAYRLRLPLPPLFIQQSPEFNAFATGFRGTTFMVVYSAMLESFPPNELLFVLGHELGHIRQRHTGWLLLFQPGRALGARFALAPIAGLLFNVWSVKAEYTADQAGLVACPDANVACRALLRLGGGVVPEGVPVGAASPERPLVGLLEYLGTHPFIANRVRHVRACATGRLSAMSAARQTTVGGP